MEDADLNRDGKNLRFSVVCFIEFYFQGVISYEEFKKSLQKAISTYFDI